MAWSKPSAVLREVLESAVAALDCERETMFGCPVYMTSGSMFAGLHQESLFIRLSPEDRASLLSLYRGAAQFEPMPGRPMKEYMVLPPSLYEDPARLGEWLDRAIEFARSLPPKESKKRR